MKHFRVSIVMATFNCAKVIEQAISSVVNQTYDNIELIIIDGGSTDGTIDIIKKYEDKIVYWVSEPDTGIYNALNKGVKQAGGDYIQILGSDDCLHDIKTIEQVIHVLQDEPDVLCCDVIFVDSELRVEWLNKTNDNFFVQAPNHQGMFTKRDILLKYPFDEQYKVAADYNFKLTCYTDKAIRIKRSSIKVAYYAIGGFSKSHVERGLQEAEKIYWNFADGKDWRKKPLFLKDWVKFLLKQLGVFEVLRLWINVYVFKKWKKHHCDNKICRWCGRGA